MCVMCPTLLILPGARDLCQLLGRKIGNELPTRSTLDIPHRNTVLGAPCLNGLLVSGDIVELVDLVGNKHVLPFVRL